MARITAYLELGNKRVFAAALDWPGWARSGKTDQEALDRLADYAERYRPVAERAEVRFPVAYDFDVLERLPGSGSTDFGAPGAIAQADHAALTVAQARRLAALVEASWAVLDEVAAQTPGELRKGPRGGGRDRDKMIQHVVSAEASYARQLDIRHREPAFDDRDAVTALRRDIAAALRSARDGTPSRPKGWPPRYAARRIAWHVLDHCWEMQDRTEPS
ncbi:MAG: hypothetical protein H0V10_11560 [Geodermatophilaceae bacterium]|nr:hypothetical protein [Geodermatophilaceae bacterium]